MTGECLGSSYGVPRCDGVARYEARALDDIEEASDPLFVVYWPLCEEHAASWRECEQWQIRTAVTTP